MRPALTSSSPTGSRGPAAVSRMSSILTHRAQMFSTRCRWSGVNPMVPMRSLTGSCDEQVDVPVREAPRFEIVMFLFLIAGSQCCIAGPLTVAGHSIYAHPPKHDPDHGPIYAS